MVYTYDELTWKNVSVEINDEKEEESKILKNVSGAAKARRVHLILGDSGSGKTTLMNLLAGYVPFNLLTNGEVLLNGKERPKNFIAATPFKQVKDGLYNKLSVMDVLKFCEGSFLKTKDLSFRIDTILTEFNLFDKSFDSLSELTESEYQRMIIACELIKESSILILDDIFSNFSDEDIKAVMKTIKKFTFDQNLITILTSRVIMPMFDEYIDDLSFLMEGKMYSCEEVLKIGNGSRFDYKQFSSQALFELIKKERSLEKLSELPSESYEEILNSNKSEFYASYNCRLSSILVLIIRFFYFGLKSLEWYVIISKAILIFIYYTVVFFIYREFKDKLIDSLKGNQEAYILLLLLMCIISFIYSYFSSFFISIVKTLFFKDKKLMHYELKKGKISTLEIFISCFLISYLVVMFNILILLLPFIFTFYEIFTKLFYFASIFIFLDGFIFYLKSFAVRNSAIFINFFLIVVVLVSFFINNIADGIDVGNYYFEFISTILRTMPQYLYLTYAFSSYLNQYLNYARPYNIFETKKKLAFKMLLCDANRLFRYDMLKMTLTLIGFLLFYSFLIYMSFKSITKRIGIPVRMKLQK